jgi:hypothetical protein
MEFRLLKMECFFNADCPNGDDERHCIALAHHLDSTEEMSYSNSGIVLFSLSAVHTEIV